MEVKFISIKAHAYIDYITAVLLILVPWMISMDITGARISRLMGSFLLLYNFFTDYPLSISASISLKVHLVLDRISGIILIVLPLLLGSPNPLFALVGLFLIVVSMNTSHPTTVWEKVQRLLRRTSRKTKANTIRKQ